MRCTIRRNAIVTLFLLVCMGAASAASLTMPTFFARRDYAGDGFVAVADVNGDKIPDVISLSGFDSVATLLGNGNGTFRQGPASTTNMFGVSLLAVDLNGDGIIDLVVASGQAPMGFGICFGNGDGTFQPAVFYPAGSELFTGPDVVGDFNGDGIPDVVTVGESGIWLFTGKGGGVFNPGVLTPVAGLNNQVVIAADFNGDGHLDLAVTLLSRGFIVVFGNGNGTFQTPITYSGPPGGGIATGDLNLDGHPDIVYQPLTGSYVYVYLNNGSGAFSPPTYVPINAGYLTIGDVNGDHIPDLVTSNGDIALGLGNGKFEPPVSYPVQTSGSVKFGGPFLADLRNIGRTDIVAAELSAISVLLNLGDGKFEDGVWTSVPGSGNCAAAADFNGDGKPDLAIPTTQGITILLGTGKSGAPYTTGSSISLSGPGCPMTGDLNGDGIPDVMLEVTGAGGVQAYLGNGDGTFRLASTTAVNPGILALGDFNHDGKLDFADSSNQLALGNGDGTFQAPVSIVANPSGGFSWIAAGDVNNDGWTDLLLTSSPSSLYVLVNNQLGGFTQSVIQNNDTPEAVFLADLNRDGNLDAVVELFLGYYVAVYLGDGEGGFTLTGRKLEYAASYPIPPSVGDVNGDGIPDLLLPADGSLEIFLGKGDGTFLTPFGVGPGPGVGQILFENMHGQSPTAGLPDLVAPDSTGGVMLLYNLTK
jgi:hypothetical protein